MSRIFQALGVATATLDLGIGGKIALWWEGAFRETVLHVLFIRPVAALRQQAELREGGQCFCVRRCWAGSLVACESWEKEGRNIWFCPIENQTLHTHLRIKLFCSIYNLTLQQRCHLLNYYTFSPWNWNLFFPTNCSRNYPDKSWQLVLFAQKLVSFSTIATSQKSQPKQQTADFPLQTAFRLDLRTAMLSSLFCCFVHHW